MYSSNLASITSFPPLIIPKAKENLELFHKYLKPTLKKLCKNDQDNWDQYINQVLTSYCLYPHLATPIRPFFLIYGRDPNFPLHQLLEPMQQFLDNPESGWLNLETYCLKLTIAKKILHQNRFKNAQKTTDCIPPSFQVGNRVYFKNKQPGNWDLKWRAEYRIVHTEHDRYYLLIKNQATGKTQSCNIKDVVHGPPVKLGNIDAQFGRAGKFINHSCKSAYHCPKY